MKVIHCNIDGQQESRKVKVTKEYSPKRALAAGFNNHEQAFFQFVQDLKTDVVKVNNSRIKEAEKNIFDSQKFWDNLPITHLRVLK